MTGRRKVCAACPESIEQPSTGRPRLYCSDACRQRAQAARNRRRRFRSEWWTPPQVRTRMLDEWPIGLDAAACGPSALVPTYLGPDHPDPGRRDALAFAHWADLAPGGTAVWLNPPYTPAATLGQFLSRAVVTAHTGRTVVGLLPASTGTAWWWEHVIDAGAQIEFLRGRLSFGGPHAGAGRGTTAPWGSAIVVWKATHRR